MRLRLNVIGKSLESGSPRQDPYSFRNYDDEIFSPQMILSSKCYYYKKRKKEKIRSNNQERDEDFYEHWSIKRSADSTLLKPRLFIKRP